MKDNEDISQTAETSPTIEMSTAVERRLKWEELRVRIEHYKYYLSRALHVTVFFYAITGGVLGFYLKDDAAARERVRYFLLLPILIGSVLGGVFIYGARLQEKAVDSMEHIRNELRERLGLDIEELYDAQLLNILLRIFGYIYFLVAVLLVFVPPAKRSASSIGFYLAASVFLLLGVSLPVVARGIDNRLKVRRTERMLKKLESWRLTTKKLVDPPTLMGTDFYYQLRQCLTKKTIEDILNEDGDNIKIALNKEIQDLALQWQKREVKRKSFKEWLAGIGKQGYWQWWTSA
jgi:hypothetical protein